MALQGNPFLGKLKIPAPDLSRIPETPFENSQVKELTQTLDKPTNEPGEKSEQSQNKPRTKLEQSESKPGTNREQSWNKVGTTPPGNHSLEFQSQNKVRSQPRTEARTELEQTQNKVGTKLPFSSVVGMQRRIIFFIFEATKIARDKITAPIAIQNLAEACQTTSMAAQVTVRRLEKKGLLIRAEFKDGRGGWTRYELPNDLFQELLQTESQNKVGANQEQSQNKVGAQPRTEPRTSLSSSSSFVLEKNFKTTTTDEPEFFENVSTQLSPEWQTLDISPLSEIGFTQTHLLQVIRQEKLSPSEVQDSIYFFAFDLKRNGKGKELNGPPLNFFMGIIRKGIPYAPPENFESPVDEARRKTREFKERKARERQDEEQQLLNLEFSEWRRELSESELSKILPEFARKPGPIQDSALKSHFETEVWPSLSVECFGESDSERQQIRGMISESLGEVKG